MKNRKLSQFILRYTIYILFLTISSTIYGQVSISGVIYDNEKNPLPGALITIKSTPHVGTTTNIDGTFQLKLKENLPILLQASLLGYTTQEINVTDANKQLIITLNEKSTTLDEVVVTALGISREKKSLGYTTQELKNEELTNSNETNIVNALTGKVAGVRITNSQGDMGSSRIIIRGETSITGNNQPLFIIDGIPVDNSQLNKGGRTRDFRNAIADLNPADIESMNVLKGPNAAALYGSRAANGVILITTKSGKGKKGLGVSVNTGIIFSKVATLPNFQNIFGQGSNGQFSYIDGKGGGINDGVDESWGPKMDGRLIPQFNSNGTAIPFVAYPNNVKDFFETGVTSEIGASVAGTEEKYNFRLGFNYQDQKGVVPNSQIKKNNFSINTNYEITPWLKVGATGNYIVTDVPALPGGPNGGRSAGVMLQFLWFGRQVDIKELKRNRDVNWNNSYYSNPYWNAYYNTTSQNRNRFIGDIHAEIKIADGLDFKFRTATDYYNDRRKYKIKYGTNGTPYGSYAEDAYTLNENNTEGLFHYNKQISNDFHIDVLGGGNIRTKKYENNYQKAPRLANPDIYNLGNSRDPLQSSNELQELKVYSMYGSAQIGYRNYIYLNITGRNEWSSTLPRHNRSFFYPSINTSLILSEILGIQNNNLDYLKIRGGWSEVGSDADPYQLQTVYNFEAPFEGNPITISSQEKKNPNLKPEKTQSTEFGTEFSLWKNRLHFDLAYYNTNSKNQILDVKTSAASGYTSEIMNAGKINNKGIEIQFDVTPIFLKDFSWNIGFNYSQNKSKVVILDQDREIESYTLGSSGGIDVLATVGKAYGTLYGTGYLRDTHGNIIVGTNGLPKTDPVKKEFGHFSPDWTGGLFSSFKYKNLELSFLIDARIGGKLFSGTNRTGQYTGVLESTLRGRDSEHGGIQYYYQNNNTSTSKIPLNGTSAPDGVIVYDDGMLFRGVYEDGTPNTTIISAQQYYKSIYNIPETYIYDASYIKFRELKLTYHFGTELISRFKLQGASITIVGRNLFFIHKNAPNIDPENAFDTGNAQGLESLSLPTTRSIGFNLNLKF